MSRPERSSRPRCTSTRTASSTSTCRHRTTTFASSPTGRCRTRRTTSARSRSPSPPCCRSPASTRRTSSASASTSPRARCCRRPPTAPRCARFPSSAAARTPGSSCGSTTPRSPRPTGSTPSPASGASPGSRATAARSRPSGSTPRRCRSSTRRRTSTQAAGRLIEAADWVVWQLTGVETRNNCTAGYKAIWSKRDGFPPDAYFAALDPRFEHVVDEKMSRRDQRRSASAPAA